MMSSDPSETPAISQNKYRLPKNVKPLHYDLTFWTDLESLKFGGFVTVDLDILEETSAIVLNCSDDLKLADASVHCATLDAGQLQSAQIVADKELGRASLNFPAALPAGSKAQVKLSYSAMLRGSMNGYYKSAWQRDGKTEYYALTHFQPTDARAAFPCWDEPQLKATFGITMISRAETVNISNMPAESEVLYDPTSTRDANLATLLSTLPKKDDQWKLTKFQKTPLMSSYLVAFANGPFAHLETKVVMPLSGRTVPLRVYATPDIIHQAEFCLEVTAKVLPLYEKIFEIEYPLPKLDTLAANDFDMGAMENWGLITGRTSAFMMDPKKPNILARKSIAGTQSHEVAHMWFGNITTMEWWDYLYLNEGFATLMGEAIVLGEFARVFPEWKVDSAFVANHVHHAMVLDAKRSSHPIEVECPDANFINQIFDGLSYSKAASVLRMLSEYIGEERFLKGVSGYLKKHLYANSVTRDLWDGISAASGEDIIGFPLITVTETSSGIHVRQDRYLNDGTPNADENETIWNIPLAILTVDEGGQAHVDKTAILEEREKILAIDTSRTFKLNAGTTSFYRVSYTPERLSKIAAEATKEGSVFSLSDRIGLLLRCFGTVQGRIDPGQQSPHLGRHLAERNESQVTLLSIPLALPIGQRYLDLVWVSALNSLAGVIRPFEDHRQINDSLRAFTRTLFVPIVQRFGYDFPEGESVDIVELRKTAIQGAVVGRDESVTQELRSRFTDYLKTGDKTRIPSDIAKPIFQTAARYGGREEFEAILKIAEDPTDTYRSSAIRNIGCTEDLGLMKELFSYILTKARDQDVVGFCLGLEANPLARRILVEFFQDNYDHNKDTTRYSMALAQSLETIRARITYIERSRDDLSDWLTKNTTVDALVDSTDLVYAYDWKTLIATYFAAFVTPTVMSAIDIFCIINLHHKERIRSWT
ncbi:Aminopeptidase 1 [Mycena venus]|uniref:Aminopeptidase n=1 Tax=Mycena venus TaxID=2733690 RepID=A0A8H7CFH4_9AGAR|nr:Aminopeptidase 1 [Mycena venus]